jgi:uncharacterized Fe-S cluster protein YjdI
MEEIIKKYFSDEITIIWKPEICTQSAVCCNGLPEVFNTANRPWIRANATTPEKIIAQIEQCPSGALSYVLNQNFKEDDPECICTVEITQNGPILIHGKALIKKWDGSEDQKTKITALCRCGASNKKPYCDGTHRKMDFKG